MCYRFSDGFERSLVSDLSFVILKRFRQPPDSVPILFDQDGMRLTLSTSSPPSDHNSPTPAVTG